jgi:monoterpene epsilon-lactone hydrolase
VTPKIPGRNFWNPIRPCLAMTQSEIDAIRALLSSKPRPIGWDDRRQRLDEVGAIWPVADDVKLTAVDAGGVPA